MMSGTTRWGASGGCASAGYRRCGYAEAVAGGKKARDAVEFIASLNPYGDMKQDAAALKPKEALRRWRCHLLGTPESES